MRRAFFIVLGGFLTAVCVFGATIWLISADARRQIDALATANTDSTQWFLAQAEVELLATQVAIYDAQTAAPDVQPGTIAEARRRFDIFYSRVSTLAASPSFAPLRGTSAGRAALAETEEYLSWAAPIMDGPDPVLIDSLPDLLAATAALRPSLRGVSLEGVRVFADRSDQQRLELARAVSDLAVVVVLLFSALMVAVLALAVMFRTSRAHAIRTENTRNRLHTVIATSSDAIIVVCEDGRILDFNEAASRMYGYEVSEAVGAHILDFLVPPEKQDEVQDLLRALRQKRRAPIRIELMQSSALRRSGEVFPVEVSVSSVVSRQGTVLVAFVRDISGRLAEQEELIEARDRAVAGEQAKARMLAVMSHEMRTPLNGVLGTLDLLKTTALNETQRRYADVMEQSGRMLLSHVNDVLDISRADSGHIELATVAFDPGQVASDVLDGLKAEAEKRGNRLVLSLRGNKSAPLIGDPGRLAQILVNLIGNAIKFTEHGRITVEIDRSRPDGEIEFRVSDTGIGIPLRDQERIFDEFVTLNTAYTRNVEGSGLGLSIVRRLVQLMGGQISVGSTPGYGTTFRVRLRLPELAVALAGTQMATPPTGPPTALLPAGQKAPPAALTVFGPVMLDVLVVEDNATNRMIVREMLIQRGCRVTEAEDGQQGVAMAGERAFDLILMDISMPRMDGLTATGLIRQSGPNTATPIIALTAYALPDEQANFRQAGRDDRHADQAAVISAA